MGEKNRLVLTKENLINIISNKCKDDYVSTRDLFKLIDECTDEDGIISRRRLIKSVKNSNTKSVIRDIYNLLENSIFDYLHSVNSEQDVSIRLFEGISLDCEYIPEKKKKNNLTGKMIFVESKVKPRFNITRNYCEKLNSNR